MSHFGSNYTKTAPSKNHKPCSKCGNTGFFCLGVENGRPISNTGFNCFKCNGTGWTVQKPRRKRCPNCGFLWNMNELGYHEFARMENGQLTSVGCSVNLEEK